MRNTNYAFSGAMYEVQKTLEAFFGRCEVTITEDKPRHAVEVEVKYKTHNEAKWYRQVITDEMLAYGRAWPATSKSGGVMILFVYSCA